MTVAQIEDAAVKLGLAVEAVKAMLAAMQVAGADGRALSVTKTQFETAFLWAANAMGGEGIL